MAVLQYDDGLPPKRAGGPGDSYGRQTSRQAQHLPLRSRTPTGDDPDLWDLIKTKFGGYVRWTAFAMLLAPAVFWITSHQ